MARENKEQGFGLMKLLCLIHNLSQIIFWGYELYLIFSIWAAEGRIVWKVFQYQGVFENLKMIQLLQFFDVFFCIIGVTRGSPVLSLMQILARNLVVLLIFEFNMNAEFPVIAIIPWCLAEVIRYPFYTLKLVGMEGFLLSIFEFLRFNAFMVLYPCGVFGELSSLYESWDILEKLRPYKLEMPNNYNFAFDPMFFYYSFFPLCPLGMLMIYFQLLGARKKYMQRGSDKVKTN